MDNLQYAIVPIGEQVDKLKKAWHKYGKIIILVDYDDTFIGHQESNKELCEEVRKVLAKAQNLGAELILWTCRQYYNIADSIEKFEEEYRIYFNEINPTEPFKEGFSHKPYCNIMLDDKCGLEQALLILKQTIQEYENDVISNNTDTSVPVSE